MRCACVVTALLAEMEAVRSHLELSLAHSERDGILCGASSLAAWSGH